MTMSVDQSARAADPRPVIQTRVDRDVLDAIDTAASRQRMTRTAWLTQAALAALPDDLRAALNRP